MSFDQLRTGPVSLEDFKTMDVDWTGHLDHAPFYWESVMLVAITIGLWVNEALEFILGITNDTGGVASVFVIPSKRVHERRIQRYILQHWRDGLNRLLQVYNPHRLQAIVNPINPSHVAFVKHFGLVYEGTLRDYTPAGLDACIYGRSLRRV